MSKVYVPGYGYVDSTTSGTSGSVRPGNSTVDTGQHKPTTNQTPTNSGWKPTASTNQGGSTSSSNPWDALGLGGPSQTYASTYGTQTTTPTSDAAKRLSDLYEYPKWTELDIRTQNLYNDLATSYYHSSTGKSWYEKQFLPYVNDIKDKTGIAPDPQYIALRFAMQNGYDVSRYLTSSPSLSPNSVLFDMPGALPGTATSDSSSSSGSSGGGSYGGGGYGGGGGATSQRIDLTSYTGAQALLTQFMQSTIGRDPKPGETEKFMELLQGYQKNNPVTATADGNTVTQSGGVDPGVVAQTYVEGLPDYKEARAQQYYKAFMSAISGGA